MKPYTLSQSLTLICEVKTIAGLLALESLIEEQKAHFSADKLCLMREMINQKKLEINHQL